MSTLFLALSVFTAAFAVFLIVGFADHWYQMVVPALIFGPIAISLLTQTLDT